jgi:hypothetical protein
VSFATRKLSDYMGLISWFIIDKIGDTTTPPARGNQERDRNLSLLPQKMM